MELLGSILAFPKNRKWCLPTGIGDTMSRRWVTADVGRRRFLARPWNEELIKEFRYFLSCNELLETRVPRPLHCPGDSITKWDWTYRLRWLSKD